jgi:hypothetical protein
MFKNPFNKKPVDPIVTAFSGTTKSQKESMLNLLMIVGGCDSQGGPHSEEMKLLNSYVDVFDVRSDQAMARLKSNGMKGIINDLQTISEDQKEMLVTMVHGMICVDGRPNETELECASNFFNAIGIDDNKYIEIVTKADAAAKHFLK